MKRVFRSWVFWIGCAVLLAVAGTVAGVASLLAPPKIEDRSWLVVDLHGDITEYDPPGGVAGELMGGDHETLTRILGNLEKAAVDERIAGVIVKVSANNSAGLAMLEEAREAVKAVRAADKRVLAWAESLDRDTIYFASACDEILAPPSAYVSFTGFALTSTHVKQMLDKLGVKPNLHKIKDYKAAAEMMLREDMSEHARENRQWLIDEIWEVFASALEADRGLDGTAVATAMERAVMTSREAVELGLVDRLLYWDELEAELKAEDDDRLRTVSQSRYAEVDRSDLDLEGDAKIAVVHAQGMIGGRESRINPLLGVMMGHETVTADLRRARLDEDVAAVIFRVDSRGGDSLTSDLIGHEVEVVARSKPIVVSMVDVAASGGYSVSYRASRIVANRMTVTGSIGSISGKFNLGGLYETIGYAQDAVTRGPNALFYDDTRDFSDEEWQRFADNHWTDFNEWLTDIAEHRGLSFEEAEKLAHGRVWSGRQAAANGLVDEVGGFAAALAAARRLAGLEPEADVELVHYPVDRGLVGSLLNSDEDGTSAASWAVYRMLRGDVADTVTFLTGPRQMMAPVEIR